MNNFLAPQKRISLYKKLNTDLSGGNICPDDILQICRSKKIPSTEESLITAAISSGRCADGLHFAWHIANCAYEVRKNVLTQIIGPVILLTLSALIFYYAVTVH